MSATANKLKRPRHNQKWYAKVARERRRLERDPRRAVCWLCGESIDMSLPSNHRAGFTLDHVVPLARGGDLMGETRPAHRACNSARGDKLVDVVDADALDDVGTSARRRRGDDSKYPNAGRRAPWHVHIHDHGPGVGPSAELDPTLTLGHGMTDSQYEQWEREHAHLRRR